MCDAILIMLGVSIVASLSFVLGCSWTAMHTPPMRRSAWWEAGGIIIATLLIMGSPVAALWFFKP